MVAGPYPTKAMFEGLKGRVAGLENAAGGAGAAPELTLDWYSEGDLATVRTPEDYRLKLSWERRTLNFAGISLPGVVEIGHLSLYGPSGQEGREVFFAPSDLKRIVERETTTYLLPRALLMSDGQLDIGLPAGSRLRTRGPLTLSTAMRLQVHNESYEPATLNLESLAIYEQPYEGLPVVPEPTWSASPYREGTAFYTPPRRVEVVWPSRGNPYLHVIEFSTKGGDGADFHLPLTPGLPQ